MVPDPMYLVRKIRAGESPLTKHAGSMAQDIGAGASREEPGEQTSSGLALEQFIDRARDGRRIAWN